MVKSNDLLRIDWRNNFCYLSPQLPPKFFREELSKAITRFIVVKRS
jgi:hypothetical protein